MSSLHAFEEMRLLCGHLGGKNADKDGRCRSCGRAETTVKVPKDEAQSQRAQNGG